MNQTRQTDLLPWAIFLGFLSLLLLLGGCGHVLPPTGGTTGNAIGLNDSARGLLVQAKPVAAEPAKSLIVAASRDLDLQRGLLEKDQTRAGEMERKLIAVDDDWIGPRAKRAGWWAVGIVGGGLVAWFGMAVILLNVGGGVWLGIGKIMYSPIGKLLNWIINGITGGPRVVAEVKGRKS